MKLPLLFYRVTRANYGECFEDVLFLYLENIKN